jgi:hypothetical protein
VLENLDGRGSARGCRDENHDYIYNTLRWICQGHRFTSVKQIASAKLEVIFITEIDVYCRFIGGDEKRTTRPATLKSYGQNESAMCSCFASQNEMTTYSLPRS